MAPTETPDSDAQPPLTTQEVATLFGVDPSTVKRWADDGKLPFLLTLGGHRRYPAAAVHALATTTPSA